VDLVADFLEPPVKRSGDLGPEDDLDRSARAATSQTPLRRSLSFKAPQHHHADQSLSPVPSATTTVDRAATATSSDDDDDDDEEEVVVADVPGGPSLK